MISEIMEKFYMFASERIAKRFYEEKYEQILKINKIMYTDKVPSVVYRNLFRILSLYNTGQEDWKIEYGLMLKNDQIKVLGESDEVYIRIFMLDYTNRGLDSEGVVLDLNDVSKHTKKLFPIDFNTPHFNAINFEKESHS